MAQQEMNTVAERAIAAYSKLKGASQPTIQSTMTVAGGDLLTIRDEVNGARTYGWYFEKGDNSKLLFTGEEIATYIASRSTSNPFVGYVQTTTLPEVVKLIVVSGLAIAFSAAVIFIVIHTPDNKSLQVLTGLAGLTIGYFVGKSDTPK